MTLSMPGGPGVANFVLHTDTGDVVTLFGKQFELHSQRARVWESLLDHCKCVSCGKRFGLNSSSRNQRRVARSPCPGDWQAAVAETVVAEVFEAPTPTAEVCTTAVAVASEDNDTVDLMMGFEYVSESATKVRKLNGTFVTGRLRLAPDAALISTQMTSHPGCVRLGINVDPTVVPGGGYPSS